MNRSKRCCGVVEPWPGPTRDLWILLFSSSSSVFFFSLPTLFPPLHPPSFSLLPFLRLHPFSSSSLFLFPFLLPLSFSRVFSLFILPFSSSSSFHPPSTVHHHHHFNDFSRRSSSVSPTVPSYSVLSSSIPSDYCVVLVCSPTSSSHPTTNRHPAISPTLPLLSVPR